MKNNDSAATERKGSWRAIASIAIIVALAFTTWFTALNIAETLAPCPEIPPGGAFTFDCTLDALGIPHYLELVFIVISIFTAALAAALGNKLIQFLWE